MKFNLIICEHIDSIKVFVKKNQSNKHGQGLNKVCVQLSKAFERVMPSNDLP